METHVKTWLETDGVEFLRSIGMRKDHIVLDFGCGEGHYAIPAAKLVGEKGQVYAIDKDQDALDRLVHVAELNKINNIQVTKEEIITTLENNSVHFILCYDVVHYLKDRKMIYHELHRLLKSKGIFSLYPKHHKNDYPLMELAHMKLDDIIGEVEESGFSLKDKFLKTLIHDDYYNEGCVLNFRKD
jgi:ubiquinone/menaquinone biosynthesis C-methylase UbiE